MANSELAAPGLFCYICVVKLLIILTMDKFVKIKPSMSKEVWLNVANIVSIKETSNGFELRTNEVREGKSEVYSVEGSLSDFFKTLGIKALSFE